MIIAYVF